MNFETLLGDFTAAVWLCFENLVVNDEITVKLSSATRCAKGLVAAVLGASLPQA